MVKLERDILITNPFKYDLNDVPSYVGSELADSQFGSIENAFFWGLFRSRLTTI